MPKCNSGTATRIQFDALSILFQDTKFKMLFYHGNKVSVIDYCKQCTANLRLQIKGSYNILYCFLERHDLGCWNGQTWCTIICHHWSATSGCVLVQPDECSCIYLHTCCKTKTYINDNNCQHFQGFNQSYLLSTTKCVAQNKISMFVYGVQLEKWSDLIVSVIPSLSLISDWYNNSLIQMLHLISSRSVHK